MVQKSYANSRTAPTLQYIPETMLELPGGGARLYLESSLGYEVLLPERRVQLHHSGPSIWTRLALRTRLGHG